jgi:serine/threonine protein kinase
LASRLETRNVLVLEGSRLAIADFGVARFAEEELYTLVETGKNTRLANFLYAAPEQRNREADVDQRADIYALGLILNEMFTREIPHGTGYKVIGSVAPQYAYLDDLVTQMLRQSPDDRPASIEVVKRELIRIEKLRAEEAERKKIREETARQETRANVLRNLKI